MLAFLTTLACASSSPPVPAAKPAAKRKTAQPSVDELPDVIDVEASV